MLDTGSDYPRSEYLVETSWLEEHLNDADLRIFDCTVEILPNPDPVKNKKFPFVFKSARDQFDLQHIPNAGFIDIPGELSDVSVDIPLMMPPAEQLTEVMSKHGIQENSCVVLYSSAEANWAARVWWMLRAVGFENVAILNGGSKKWCDEGRQMSSEPCTYAKSEFKADLKEGAFVTKSEVSATLNKDETCLISALPEPIHTGTSDVAFGRKGCIPGSVNIPFMNMHNPETGAYLPIEQLKELFSQLDIEQADKIISYCGGGVAAANIAFVLTLLGYKNVAVYDGSMLEWGNDLSLPMEVMG